MDLNNALCHRRTLEDKAIRTLEDWDQRATLGGTDCCITSANLTSTYCEHRNNINLHHYQVLWLAIADLMDVASLDIQGWERDQVNWFLGALNEVTLVCLQSQVAWG